MRHIYECSQSATNLEKEGPVRAILALFFRGTSAHFSRRASAHRLWSLGEAAVTACGALERLRLLLRGAGAGAFGAQDFQIFGTCDECDRNRKSESDRHPSWGFLLLGAGTQHPPPSASPAQVSEPSPSLPQLPKPAEPSKPAKPLRCHRCPRDITPRNPRRHNPQ